MGFIEYLGKFTKKIFFFVGGFIIAFPIGGSTMYVGSTVEYNPIPVTTYNPIFVAIGLIFVIVGFAMMFYCAKMD